MATRSPVEAHNYWGIYATPATLAAVIGDPRLQSGDFAFVASTAQPYVFDGVAWRQNPTSFVPPSAAGQVLTWNGTEWVPALGGGGSGGGGVIYYFDQANPGDPPIVGLNAATKTIDTTAQVATTTVTSGALGAGWTFVAGFVTDVGVPGTTDVPAGVWDFNLWADTSSVVPNDVSFRASIYAYNGVAPTLIATSVSVGVSNPGAQTQYITSVLVPATVIAVTDRVYVVLEATTNIPGDTITFSFGGLTPSHIHTTLPSVGGTGIVHVVNGVIQTPASPVNFAGGATEITGTLPVGNGGTGLATTPTNGQLLIGNGAGYTQATLTAGSGIVVTNGAGSVSIAASGAPVLEQDRMFVYEGEYFDDTNDEWREPKGNQAILARNGGTATTVAAWANGRPAVLCSGGRMQAANAVTSTPGNVLTVAVAGTYTLLSATNVGCFNIGNANKIFGVVNGLVAGVAKLQLWPTAAGPIAAMHITSTAFGGNKFVYVARYMQRAYRHTIYVQGVGTFSASSTDATAQPFSFSDLAIGGWFASGGVYEQPIACLHAYRYKSDAEMDAIRDALQAAYAL